MGGKKRDEGLPSDLSQPALRALHGAGIRNLSDVRRFDRGALAHLHGVGPKALRILADALAAGRRSDRD